ncbi:MAG TPA: ribosome-associated translation inhibitor RaiA [Trueperaceae bacterium]
MKIYELKGRNLEVTDAMRSYAEEKLGRLERFGPVMDARVVMSFGGDGVEEPARVEVQVKVPNGLIRAEERGRDTYAAVDKVIDKLERQMKKFKGRFLAKRTEEVPAPPLPEPEPDGPAIVRVKRHVLRPMAPEDAALQMEALGHNFFMFRNLETDEINVIYLRHDGDYGLIEPAN